MYRNRCDQQLELFDEATPLVEQLPEAPCSQLFAGGDLFLVFPATQKTAAIELLGHLLLESLSEINRQTDKEKPHAR